MTLTPPDKISPALPPPFDDRYEFLVLVAIPVLAVLIAGLLYPALDYVARVPFR